MGVVPGSIPCEATMSCTTFNQDGVGRIDPLRMSHQLNPMASYAAPCGKAC